MRKLLLLAVLLSGCAPKSYTLTIPQPPATLLPSSHELQSYTGNTGLSAQLDRTTAQCGIVKQAISAELDTRQHRLTVRKTILVSLGGVAGTAASVYAGVAKSPDSRVITTLGAFSGGALLTAIPALGTDDRIATLTDKLSTIRSQETAVLGAWNAMEAQLLVIALLKQPPTPNGMALAKAYQDAAPMEQTLRLDLASLGNSCQ